MIDALGYILAAEPDQLALVGRVAVIVATVLAVIYLWFLQECLLDLPAADRRAAPWVVWLMLMPYIGPLVAWIVIPYLVPRSFAGFFARRGSSGFGDCGRLVGLVWMLCLSTAAPVAVLGSPQIAVVLMVIGLAGFCRYTWLLIRMRRTVRGYRRLQASAGGMLP